MRDLWNHKDSDDILSFMKFEYKNFCMGGTFLIFNFCLVYWFSGEYGEQQDIIKNSLTYYKEQNSDWYCVLIFLIVIIINRLVLFLYMQRLQQSNGVNYKIYEFELPMIFGYNIVSFLAGVAFYVWYIIQEGFDPFIDIWFFAELLNSFIVIPYYYVICKRIYKDVNQNYLAH